MGFSLRPPGLTAALLVMLCGCDSSINECQQDSDCPSAMGLKLFCTSEHLCVSGTPKERLCQETYPEYPSPTAIPIGVYVEVAGAPLMQMETLLTDAIKLGVKQVNSILAQTGRQFVVHICDINQHGLPIEYLNQDAVKATEILVNERKVVALIGPLRSTEVLSVASQLRSYQVPAMSPGAAASEISALEQPSFIFRVVHTSRPEAKLLAGLIPKQKPLGLAYVDEVIGRSYLQEFLSAWVDPVVQNMPVVAVKFPSLDLTQLQPVAQTLLDKKPSTVLLFGLQEHLPVLTQLLVPLDPASDIFMHDNGKSQAMLDLIGKLPDAHLQRIQGIAAALAQGSGEYASFRSAFMGEFGVDPSSYVWTNYFYDAFYAVAIAIGSIADTPTGPKVAAALLRMTSSSPNRASIGPASYLDAIGMLRAGGLRLDGTTGSIGFSSNGDRDSALFEGWRIDVANRKFISTGPL